MDSKRPVGRPRKSGSKKTAFSCSILPETASEAIKVFGSIGKAVEWAVNNQNGSSSSKSGNERF